MKVILLLTFIIASKVFAFDCAPVATPEWKELAPGVSWAKFDARFKPYLKEEARWSDVLSRSITVRAFKVDLKRNKLLLHSAEKDLSCSPEKERYIQRLIDDQSKAAIGAINASFFIMPSGGILGLALDQQRVWSSDLTNLKKQSAGIFVLRSESAELIAKKDFVERFGDVLKPEDRQGMEFAIEAYPQLLRDGRLLVDDSVLNSRRSRTSIGVAAESDEILLVTIDARAETSKTGMTLFEYAHFLKESKCGVSQKIALNLDGGGSSAFAIPATDLYEQADRCRHLGNILTIHSR
jgi:uncharacterized protein YigE (DUF2233 family)